MRKVWIFLAGAGVLLAAALLGFVIWAQNPLGPMPEAETALVSDGAVEVRRTDWIEFRPTASTPRVGLILYPGGRVDPVSYAPPARQIALEGYLVVIVPMPLNLAVFGSDRAVRVIQAHPQIESWAIGGHSLGGAMAAAFVSQRPEMVDGLVLWDAYPPSSSDLSTLPLKAASIYSSSEGSMLGENLEKTRPLLPAGLRLVPVAGGNHAQFGWYGEQPGDNQAAISRPEQQALVVEATVELLKCLEESLAR
jgi:hypothetical protein